MWLFGSRAKGTYAPDSDWDVLAVVSDGTDVENLLRNPMVLMLRRRNIDLIVATESEFEEGKEAFGSLANIAVSEGIRVQ
ncbi:MAG: nucleotidyltransferase domain-containing protein [Polyangiaceae bacterium]